MKSHIQKLLAQECAYPWLVLLYLAWVSIFQGLGFGFRFEGGLRVAEFRISGLGAWGLGLRF